MTNTKVSFSEITKAPFTRFCARYMQRRGAADVIRLAGAAGRWLGGSSGGAPCISRRTYTMSTSASGVVGSGSDVTTTKLRGRFPPPTFTHGDVHGATFVPPIAAVALFRGGEKAHTAAHFESASPVHSIVTTETLLRQLRLLQSAPGFAVNGDDDQDGGFHMASVKRKRRKAMSKHKHRKRLKRDRHKKD